MSADNWANCPRCQGTAQDLIVSHAAQLMEAFGKVTAREFAALCRRQEDEKAELGDRPTFREDYEIYGAADGVVMVSYNGQCTKCGLKLAFKEEHPFWPETTS